MSPKISIGSGTVVPVSYLTGSGGGCPFCVLSETVKEIKKSFSEEQAALWAAIKKEVASIEEEEGEEAPFYVMDVVLGCDVAELLCGFAPPGHWWGSHPDGGCLGFWPDSWLD